MVLLVTYNGFGALSRRTHLRGNTSKLVGVHVAQQSLRRICTSCRAQVVSDMPSWAAREPTWNPSTRKQLNHLMDLFTLADKDGNGILDRREVHHLLESDSRCLSGICTLAQHHWLTAADLDEILYQYDVDNKGGLSFSQFMELVLDGVLLDGSMDQYRTAFAAADCDGDGMLDASEVTEVLQQITGKPTSAKEVQQIMTAAGVKGDILMDFSLFLRLFRSRLMDIPRLLSYMMMKTGVLCNESPQAATQQHDQSSSSSSSIGDGLTMVSSAQQLDSIMQQLPPSTLLVAMFGLSGDAVCQATATAVQELAAVYTKAVFVSSHIDTCPEAKTLFKHVLLGRYVPAFYFFKGGQLCHSHADSSAAVLEQHLREHLSANEQPVQPVVQLQKDSKQRQQQGLAGDASSSAAAEGDGEVEPYVIQGYSLADLVYDSL